MAKNATTAQRRLISISQAAVYLGVTDRTIRNYISAGSLPAKRIQGSRLIRVDQADLDALLRAIPTTAGDAS